MKERAADLRRDLAAARKQARRVFDAQFLLTKDLCEQPALLAELAALQLVSVTLSRRLRDTEEGLGEKMSLAREAKLSWEEEEEEEAGKDTVLVPHAPLAPPRLLDPHSGPDVAFAPGRFLNGEQPPATKSELFGAFLQNQFRCPPMLGARRT